MKLIVCGGRNIDKICFVRAVRRSDKKQQPTRKDKPSLKQTAQNSWLTFYCRKTKVR